MMSQRIRHEYGGFANKVNEVGSLAPERRRLARAGPSCFCRKSTGINHSVAIPAVTLQYRHIAISHTREALQFMSCNDGVNYYKNTQLSISKRLPHGRCELSEVFAERVAAAGDAAVVRDHTGACPGVQNLTDGIGRVCVRRKCQARSRWRSCERRSLPIMVSITSLRWRRCCEAFDRNRRVDQGPLSDNKRIGPILAVMRHEQLCPGSERRNGSAGAISVAPVSRGSAELLHDANRRSPDRHATSRDRASAA
jgi:hypothetical protein